MVQQSGSSLPKSSAFQRFREFLFHYEQCEAGIVNETTKSLDQQSL